MALFCTSTKLVACLQNTLDVPCHVCNQFTWLRYRTNVAAWLPRARRGYLVSNRWLREMSNILVAWLFMLYDDVLPL